MADPVFAPLPLGDFAWLRLYYFDVVDEVASWMVRQYNRTLGKSPLEVAGWLAELAVERSAHRRGLRWYESFAFRNPEAFRDGDTLACHPSSYDLFHVCLEGSDVGWSPNVTLDPALLGRWTGLRSDGRAVDLTLGSDARFVASGLPLGPFVSQWCVYDGGAQLMLRFVEDKRPPAVVEWGVMPLSSSKIQVLLPDGALELTHDGKGEPSYVGEWLGGGELRARATGLRLVGRAGDGRGWLTPGSLRKALAATGGIAPSAIVDVQRPLVARLAACAREAAARLAEAGDARTADELRHEAQVAADRVALAGDRFVLAPHREIHDEVAAGCADWLHEILRGEFRLGPGQHQ